MLNKRLTHETERASTESSCGNAAMASSAMALQRSPLLPTTSIGSSLSSRAQNSSHFDAISVGNKQHLVQLSRSRVCCPRASIDDGTSQQTSSSFPPPGELQYFGKLSASCVAGAVLVKYGSVCVPSITTPNLDLALVMIVTPCLVSVALLTLASIVASNNTSEQ